MEHHLFNDFSPAIGRPATVVANQAGARPINMAARLPHTWCFGAFSSVRYVYHCRLKLIIASKGSKFLPNGQKLRRIMTFIRFAACYHL